MIALDAYAMKVLLFKISTHRGGSFGRSRSLDRRYCCALRAVVGWTEYDKEHEIQFRANLCKRVCRLRAMVACRRVLSSSFAHRLRSLDVFFVHCRCRSFVSTFTAACNIVHARCFCFRHVDSSALCFLYNIDWSFISSLVQI